MTPIVILSLAPITRALERAEELLEDLPSPRAAPALPRAALMALALRKKSRRSRELFSEDMGAPFWSLVAFSVSYSSARKVIAGSIRVARARGNSTQARAASRGGAAHPAD